MRIEGLSQNTPEWIVHRHGMVTASRVADVMSKRKDGKESAPRKKYKTDLMLEVLTGKAAEHYVTPAMEFGLENQPLAAEAYEQHTGIEIEEGGFWVNDRIPRFGASPDYLVGDDGLMECKVPNTDTHIDTLLSEEIDEAYLWQMQAQMACTGREWCDFVSYDPRLPKQLRLFVKRVPRDEKLIAAMEFEIILFLEETIEKLKKLTAKAGMSEEPELSIAEAKGIVP